jgi:hypothetical protein
MTTNPNNLTVNVALISATLILNNLHHLTNLLSEVIGGVQNKFEAGLNHSAIFFTRTENFGALKNAEN